MKKALKKLKRISDRNIPVDVIKISKRFFFLDIFCAFKIYNYIKNYNFDVIHSHSSKAGFLFRLISRFSSGKIYNIYTPHCFYFVANKNSLQKYVMVLLERFMSKITDAIIISENEKESVIREKIVDPEKIFVINNSVDNIKESEKKNDKTIREKNNIPQDHTIVLGVGRLVWQKTGKLLLI